MTNKNTDIIIILFLICSLLSFKFSYSQSCNGTLGEPIIDQTFGSGNVSALSSNQTTYNYINNSCPADGQYTIVNSVSGSCFGNYWHNLTEDHTINDTKGNMLLVNASYQAGDFYNQIVENLCSGTTFEFSAWVLNLVIKRNAQNCTYTPVQVPNITMQIETLSGIVLQKINTGSIQMEDVPKWNKYATLFSLPSGINSIRLRLINNEVGGCGNDLVLDDISFRVCGPPMSLKFNSTTETDYTVCEGTKVSASVSISTNGYLNPSFQWQISSDGLNWQNIIGADKKEISLSTQTIGKKYYRVLGSELGNITSLNCRVISNTLQLNVINPNLSASPVANIIACNKILLKANASTNFIYWTGKGINNIQAIQDTLSITGKGKETFRLRVFYSKADTSCYIDKSIEATFPEIPQIDLGNDKTICDGETFEIIPDIKSTDTYSFRWNTGETTKTIKASKTSTYKLTASIGSCSASDSLKLTINPIPKILKDETVCKDTIINLTAGIIDNNLTYLWEHSGETTRVVTVRSDGIYKVKISNQFGCSVTRAITVIGPCNPKIFAPNAFTPNGDNTNDIFKVYILGGIITNFTVYNRWGNPIYTDEIPQWDGKIKGENEYCPSNIYVYTLKYRTLLDNNEHEFYGVITLIR